MKQHCVHGMRVTQTVNTACLFIGLCFFVCPSRPEASQAALMMVKSSLQELARLFDASFDAPHPPREKTSSQSFSLSLSLSDSEPDSEARLAIAPPSDFDLHSATSSTHLQHDHFPSAALGTNGTADNQNTPLPSPLPSRSSPAPLPTESLAMPDPATDGLQMAASAANDAAAEAEAIKKAEAESKAEAEEKDLLERKVNDMIAAAGLQQHPSNTSNRLIRHQGDCMFDFLGLCKHLGYFGDPPGSLEDYHGKVRRLASRITRHHVIAVLANRPDAEDWFSSWADTARGDKTLKQTLIDLLQEGTPRGWSCFPLPDALSFIFPVPFEEFSPVFNGVRSIPDHPQLPPDVYPPLRFAHVWGKTHYVPLIKIDAAKELAEHNLRLKHASSVCVDWKPLPAWLAAEWTNLRKPTRKKHKSAKNTKERTGDLVCFVLILRCFCVFFSFWTSE